MMVTVKLFASLRAGRFDGAVFELPDGAVIGTALAAAGVSEREAAVIFLNARHSLPPTALADGDLVAVFPLVGGG